MGNPSNSIPTWFWWFLDPYKSESIKALPPHTGQTTRFSLAQIQSASNYFTHATRIYKGYIHDLDMAVAIKRWEPFAAENIKMKIKMLSRVSHRNLVSLIGYCEEQGNMITVYEFMGHGNLRDSLHCRIQDRLPWKRRLQICIGAARGLDHLHTGTDEIIIHSDVKSANILLDNNWVAKVSYLDMCQMGPSSFTMNGTPGYLDPSSFCRGRLTVKSDVYSFGVVLFEVLCAKEPLIETDWQGNQMKTLMNNVRMCINENVDPSLRGKIAPECLIKYLEIAESCVSDDARRRPTMGKVVEDLEIALELQQIYYGQGPGLSSPFGGRIGMPYLGIRHIL